MTDFSHLQEMNGVVRDSSFDNGSVTYAVVVKSKLLPVRFAFYAEAMIHLGEMLGRDFHGHAERQQALIAQAIGSSE